MHLRIFHRTHYQYRWQVSASYNELRLHPVSNDPKRIDFFLLNIYPPTRIQHFRDENLNYVHWFELTEPHGELSIEVTSQIYTLSEYEDGRPLGVKFGSLQAEELDMMRPFLGDSRYISMEQDLWRMAIDIRDGNQDMFETAEAIMGHVYRNWRYDPFATNSSTHVREAFAKGAGVCQDFAHLMIGFCRALGIPTRYVSGYVYGGGSADLRGTQASHAWCEVFLPGRGWFGLDPTNLCLTDERYVKIATGKDYDDAAPIRGRLSGPMNATSALQVQVEIEEL